MIEASRQLDQAVFKILPDGWYIQEFKKRNWADENAFYEYHLIICNGSEAVYGDGQTVGHALMNAVHNIKAILNNKEVFND